MSSTDSSIDGNSLSSVARTMEIVKEAAAIGDTDITWLRGEDGEPYAAIVTPDVVKAAREFWAEISREVARHGRGLPKL